MSEGIWIVEVDGVPVRMRQDPPEPKPLVGACVVRDVLYVRAEQAPAPVTRIADLLAIAVRQANDSERADSERYHRHFITLAVENVVRAVEELAKRKDGGE